MKDHPKFGKCPTTLKEVEARLLHDVNHSCGGYLAASEFYLEVISDMNQSNAWKDYANEREIES